MKMQPHELANLFPWIEDARFDELVASIKQNGLLEPIWTLDGKILDGRNRYKACYEAGVTPITRPYEGDDPLGFVIAMNLNRRHLDESQRSMVAAKIATLKHGGNRRTDQDANLRLDPTQENTGENGTNSGESQVSQGEAAKIMQVSNRSVTAAKAVKSKGSESLIKAVESGSIAVSNAEKLAKAHDHKTQDAVVALVADGMKFADALKQVTAKPKGPISGGTTFDPTELDNAPPNPQPSVKDKTGTPVPDALRPIFVDFNSGLQGFIAEAERLEKSLVKFTVDNAAVKPIRLSQALQNVAKSGGKDGYEISELTMLRHKLRRSMAHAVCRFCGGKSPDKCTTKDPVTGTQVQPCNGRGWNEKEAFDKAEKIKA